MNEEEKITTQPTDEEKIDTVAREILERFKPAFLELAK